MQNITTAEPDDSMLEVALRSFETMLALEENQPVSEKETMENAVKAGY